jgi:hypothetical protein
MKTNVYVDGFNLYYGCLRGTPYKWLDLQSLFSKVLGDNFEVQKIKLFTAKVKSRPDDPTQAQRQTVYLRALKAYIPKLEIHYGHFLSHNVTMPLANPSGKKKFAEVVKTEEKGSDVNLAVHLLNDAWIDDFECAFVVSNDSDMAEALKLVRAQENKKIGVVTPGEDRKISRELYKYANFQRKIRNWALQDSQLPDSIPGTNLTKPSKW